MEDPTISPTSLHPSSMERCSPSPKHGSWHLVRTCAYPLRQGTLQEEMWDILQNSSRTWTFGRVTFSSPFLPSLLYLLLSKGTHIYLSFYMSPFPTQPSPNPGLFSEPNLSFQWPLTCPMSSRSSTCLIPFPPIATPPKFAPSPVIPRIP